MKWQRGHDAIDAQLAAGQLERCDATPRDAAMLLADGKQYLEQARQPEVTDPTLVHRLAFRAVASCAGALLAAQGLRQTPAGGLAAVSEAVTSQFGGEVGPTVFGALCTMAEHPIEQGDVPSVDAQATEALDAADWAVAFTTRLLDAGTLHAFDGPVAVIGALN